MTFQNTIQLLYADIAAIKKFICQEDAPSVFVAYAGSSMEHTNFPIPIEAKKIVIYSDVYQPYSKIFNRNTSFYDEYTYEGLGAIMQSEDLNNGHWAYPRTIVNMQLMIIAKIKSATMLHIRPRLGIEMYITYYT